MMNTPNFPKCYKKETKPSTFCPGCGHSLTLKILGQVIDGFDISKKTVFGVDIGCSLLAWDFFDVDTVQTHHGRVSPVMKGIKMGNEKAVAIAYMGDGGGYAIGLQSFIYLAMRNDPVTVILINNTLYGMTGGQKAPTTLKRQITSSSPGGAFTEDEPFMGPEMIVNISNGKAYIARASVGNLFNLKKRLQEALLHQINGRGFSFVEVLSMCPLNWKTDSKKSLEFLRKMEKVFPQGVVSDGKSN